MRDEGTKNIPAEFERFLSRIYKKPRATCKKNRRCLFAPRLRYHVEPDAWTQARVRCAVASERNKSTAQGLVVFIPELMHRCI